MPSIHYSSFEAGQSVVDAETGDPTVLGFLEQTRNVLVGVDGAIQRALTEGWSMVLEGVHLVPGMVPRRIDGVLVVHAVLAIESEDVHRTHFHVRDLTTGGVRAMDKYLEQLDDIRRIQTHIVRRAEKTGRAGDRELEPRARDRGADGARAPLGRAPGGARVTDLRIDPERLAAETGPAHAVHLRELRARDRARRAGRRALARAGRPGRGRGGGVLGRALRARVAADQRPDRDRRARGRRPARGRHARSAAAATRSTSRSIRSRAAASPRAAATTRSR